MSLSLPPPLSARGVVLSAADIHVSSSRVGTGRLGTVQRGLWLSQPVAIKRVLPATEQRADPLARERLEREIGTLIPHLAHPALLPLYGLHIDALGTLYLVFKLGERGSLKDELRSVRGVGLPLPVFFRIAIGVASALTYLHALGIVYRELKPGSIILDSALFPLIDPEFGAIREVLQIVTARQRLTAQRSVSGRFVSDAAYLAPEVFEGTHGHGGASAIAPGAACLADEVATHAAAAAAAAAVAQPTCACDVWSFGVLLLECLTGDAPFPMLHELAIHAALTRGERPPIPDRVPPPLAQIVRDCMRDEPERRPTARSLLAALVAAQATMLPDAAADSPRRLAVAAAGESLASAPPAAVQPAPASGPRSNLLSLFAAPPAQPSGLPPG